MNVLIISGHPDLATSVATVAIVDEFKKQLPNAQIRDLGALYPDYQIDVKAEQEALRWADLIVWQFPFYWYTVPALMKKWLDDVFLHGFAHGSKGELGGKKLLVSFTTGAPAAAYTGEEGSMADMRELVAMYESVAKLCRLDYQGAMWLNGVSYVTRQSEADIAAQQQTSREYAQQVVARIKEIAG